jgi:hypothetical protein
LHHLAGLWALDKPFASAHPRQNTGERAALRDLLSVHIEDHEQTMITAQIHSDADTDVWLFWRTPPPVDAECGRTILGLQFHSILVAAFTTR